MNEWINKQSCPAKVLPRILFEYDNYKATKTRFSLNMTPLKNTHKNLCPFLSPLLLPFFFFKINEEIWVYMQSNCWFIHLLIVFLQQKPHSRICQGFVWAPWALLSEVWSVSAWRISSWWSVAPTLPVVGLLLIHVGRRMGTSCGCRGQKLRTCWVVWERKLLPSGSPPPQWQSWRSSRKRQASLITETYPGTFQSPLQATEMLHAL